MQQPFLSVNYYVSDTVLGTLNMFFLFIELLEVILQVRKPGFRKEN